MSQRREGLLLTSAFSSPYHSKQIIEYEENHKTLKGMGGRELRPDSQVCVIL
jgi:hypothetical protein